MLSAYLSSKMDMLLAGECDTLFLFFGKRSLQLAGSHKTATIQMTIGNRPKHTPNITHKNTYILAALSED